MSFGRYNNVIGIELSEEFATLIQIEIKDGNYVITNHRLLSLPPKTIVNGEIIDPELMSDYLMKIFEEAGFSSHYVCVSLNTMDFVKKAQLMAPMKPSEVAMEVELQISQSGQFLQDEFNYGYQMRRDGEKVGQGLTPVLFSAQAKASVESLQEVVELMELELIAVNPVPLSALRLMMSQIGSEPTLTIYVDHLYLDINIVRDEEVLLTHCIRRKVSDCHDDSMVVDTILQRIRHCIFSYEDTYQYAEITTIHYFSRLDDDEFLPLVQTFFSDMTIEMCEMGKQFILHEQSLPNDKIEDIQITHFSAAGLALFAFESTQKPINLIKKSHGWTYLINRKELVYALAALSVTVLMVFSVDLYFKYAMTQTGKKMVEMRKSIKALQSGEFLLRQKSLEKNQKLIKYYGSIRKEDHSKVKLFDLLLQKLPEDVSLKSVRYLPNREIYISAESYYKESVFAFYNELEEHFKNVKIKKMDSRVLKQGVRKNFFDVEMRWK